jgi:hypothetical protein
MQNRKVIEEKIKHIEQLENERHRDRVKEEQQNSRRNY